MNTILVLTGVGIPPYSARGLVQELRPIGASSQLRRTVNGALQDLADPLFQKYESTITGDDQDPPALGQSWPGMLITVDCIQEIAQAGEIETDDTENFERVPVPGSIRVADGFTFYRPRLGMRIVDFQVETDEWGAKVSWSLQLEEA